ncbi:ATP-binding protein [Ramlibacter sp.]|uniref:ATP-binding protein n=1 Tax=Ramlibacter sp. TaxID=1917967 RepID=UPI0017F323F8|nr:ATP-binding protein [Ramlibacter sp.]MBA2675480.1 response regulator [Ramlibacter sp.]
MTATASGPAGSGPAIARRPLLTRTGAWIAMVAGVLVLLGWCLDQALLKSVVPGAVHMKPNTALGLLGAGAALWLALGRRTARTDLLRACIGVALGLLGVATLAQYLAGVNLGIDQLLFRDTAHAFNAAPGRMSPFTAWSFVMLGICLALLGQRGWRGRLVVLCSVQVALIGGLALLGYLWNAVELVTDAWAPPVALNTAVALLGLGIGIVAEHIRIVRAARRDDAFVLIERRLVLAFWGMVLVLVLTASFTYRSNMQFASTARMVEHTQQVRLELAALDGCMDHVESAQRLYMLMSNAEALGSFRSTAQSCGLVPQNILALVSDNPAEVARAQALRALVPQRLDELHRMTAVFQSRGLDAARAALAFSAGPLLMRRIEGAIAEMDQVERGLLATRQARQSHDQTVMLVSLLATLVAAVGIFALLIRAMLRGVRASGTLREEMQQQKALLRAVVDSVPHVIAYKDKDGGYLGCNGAFAAMIGKSVEQVAGCRAGDLFPASYAGLTQARDREALSRMERTVVEDWVHYPDGKQRLMEVMRTPLRKKEGEPIGLVVIGCDITERKKAEDEMVRARELAEQAARTKAAFLANMSHEIRTPLTGMLGMADLLAAETLTPAQQSYVGTMRSSGKHLLNVINDILDFSRSETGKLELECIDFSLPQVLERLRSLAQPLATDRGLQLHMNLTPHSPVVVRGDPTRLTQVLLNLASNAIKFTERGSVTVHASQHVAGDGTARFRFEVRDTGMGIAPQTLAQLFAPFVQADSSTVRRFGGSGLGLAISKRLVEAMGGSIGATSEPGHGSVFFFEIPLQPGDPNAIAKPGTAGTPAPEPRRILVAEDVAVNRDILRLALTRQGHTLVLVEDGAQALALVQQQPFDLVLMDVQMPVMDGVEATRRIRKLDGPLRDIPIVGLTANVMAHERARYLDAGMSDCVMKPIDWDQLNAAISRCARIDPPDAVAPAEEKALVDEKALGTLRGFIGDAQVQALLRDGMVAFQDYCDSMREGADGESGIGRDAHKLKGSAGTFGLAALCSAAEDIEAAVDRGDSGAPRVPALQDVLQRTRRELTALGLLAAA